jgi:hypothetical protein
VSVGKERCDAYVCRIALEVTGTVEAEPIFLERPEVLADPGSHSEARPSCPDAADARLLAPNVGGRLLAVVLDFRVRGYGVLAVPCSRTVRPPTSTSHRAALVRRALFPSGPAGFGFAEARPTGRPAPSRFGARAQIALDAGP